MTTVGETVRLRGVARGSAKVLVGRAILSAPGWARPDVLVRESFEIELDGGARVRVLADKVKARAIVPLQTARGVWEKLRETPFADVLSDPLPGPSVALELKSAAISPGDAIEVYGTVTALRFEDSVGGLREAPTAHLGEVRATIVAGGKNPTTAMNEALAKLVPAAAAAQRETPPTPPQRFSRGPLVLLALGFVTPLAGLITPRRVDMLLDVAMLGFTLLASALVWSDHEQVRALGLGGPRKVSEEEGPATSARTQGGVFALECVLLMFAIQALAFVLIDMVRAMDHPTAPVSYAATTTPCLAALIAGAVGMRLYHARSTMRTIKILLDAPAHPKGLPDRAWGASEGRVSDPTPVRTSAGAAALAMITDTEITPGSDANIMRVDVRTEGTFLIETTEGLIEVDPRDAQWGSTVRERTHEPADKEKGRLARVHEVELIPLGANALIAGRIRRDKSPGAPARIVSTGPESLVLFATSAEVSPRAHLRSFRRRHRITVALLALLAAQLTVMVVAAWRDIPPAPVSSGD